MTTKRVLYAEDEFTNRKLLEMKLKNHGISCDLAHDGVQALELFQKNSYNLVILDQYMPGMNGDQVARRIRETHPELPLIAITSDDGEIERLNAAGFNEVFIKPLRGQHYIDSIKNYLT
ncbi:response regulator [Marispirochaeta aestuarii]|uniref:response regulator n=1 Tax=Marispirochaeta aestuarii TaxID=1963862 RepID=UPI0029C6E2BF|nr:response regulator [Marispirochaeta aestuarii]